MVSNSDHDGPNEEEEADQEDSFTLTLNRIRSADLSILNDYKSMCLMANRSRNMEDNP